VLDVINESAVEEIDEAVDDNDNDDDDDDDDEDACMGRSCDVELEVGSTLPLREPVPLEMIP